MDPQGADASDLSRRTDTPDAGIELVRGDAGPHLSGLVHAMTGYREHARRPWRTSQPANLIFPLIVSFGEPFRIGLGHRPGRGDLHASFGAGLFAGPVMIESGGASHCLQIDFTPLGARRFFGVPMSALAGGMIPLDDIFGHEGHRLRERLGNTPDWPTRFDIAREFALRRLAAAPRVSAEAAFALSRIVETGGRIPVSHVAAGIDRSRKHLAALFRQEFGLGAKQVSRIVRFNALLGHARSSIDGWADLAAQFAYADQAHLTREFTALAGTTPAEWRRAA